MTRAEFRHLSFEQKWTLIKNNEHYLGSRKFESFRIDLHFVEGLYVEVWRRIGLGHIYWIETTNENLVLTNYAELFDISDFTQSEE